MRRPVPALLVIALLAPCAALPQTAPGPTPTRSERNFTTFAFAHELGSGVYEAGGHLMQIYRLPFARRLREADAEGPGLTLLLPTTFGFLDFSPYDLIETGLPDKLDSISFVPGLELEFPLGEGWRVLPYARIGVEIADTSELGGTLYSAGTDAEYVWSRESGWRGRHVDGFVYSGVDFRGDLPGDTFLRFRSAVEGTQGLGWKAGSHEFEGGIFALVDWFADPPSGPVANVDIPAVQIEAGVMLGTRPGLRWRRVPIPRIGLSYRYAGDVSVWRLVLGAPF